MLFGGTLDRGELGALPLVRMPKARTRALQFTLEDSGVGGERFRARRARERAATRALPGELGLTDAHAAELADALGKGGSCAARENALERRLAEQLCALPPLRACWSETARVRPVNAVSHAVSPGPVRRRLRDARRSKKRSSSSSRRAPVVPRAPLSAAATLRQHLLESQTNSEALARSLTADVAAARDLVGSSHIDASQFGAAAAYVRASGLDRLERVFARALRAEVFAFFEEWKEFVEALRVADVARRRMRQAAALCVWRGFTAIVRDLMRRAWTAWRLEVLQAGSAEVFEQRSRSAVEMQRTTRGHAARCEMRRRLFASRAARREARCVAIQSLCRCRAALKNFHRLREERVANRAAVILQSVARSRLSRKRVLRELSTKRETAAATALQAALRGCTARAKVARLRLCVLEKRSATSLQNAQRARLAKRRCQELRKAQREKRAASQIQSLARAVTARERCARLELQRETRRVRRATAAVRIQTVQRRVLAHSATCDRLRDFTAKRQRHFAAAALVQRRARGAQARLACFSKREQRRAVMISDARKCVETWSEEDARFVYYSETSRQTAWEPPPSGYLRRDALLVLTTGRVMEDPENTLDDARRAHNAAENAANQLLGSLSRKVAHPLEQVRDFLAERLALPLESSDVRAVQDEDFDAFCTTLQELADGLHKAGRLGKPGKRGGDGGGGGGGDDDDARGRSRDDRDEDEDRVVFRPAAVQEPSPQTSAQSASAQEQLPEGCWEAFADDAGVPYYFNSATAESTYDAPANFQQLANNSPLAASDWSQHQDDADEWYWYNSNTGASQYEQPENNELAFDHSQFSASYDDTSHYDQQALESALPPDWEAFADDQAQTYYFNAQTGESTYDPPSWDATS